MMPTARSVDLSYIPNKDNVIRFLLSLLVNGGINIAAGQGLAATKKNIEILEQLISQDNALQSAKVQFVPNNKDSKLNTHTVSEDSKKYVRGDRELNGKVLFSNFNFQGFKAAKYPQETKTQTLDKNTPSSIEKTLNNSIHIKECNGKTNYDDIAHFMSECQRNMIANSVGLFTRKRSLSSLHASHTFSDDMESRMDSEAVRGLLLLHQMKELKDREISSPEEPPIDKCKPGGTNETKPKIKKKSRIHMCHFRDCYRIFPSISRLLRHERAHSK